MRRVSFSSSDGCDGRPQNQSDRLAGHSRGRDQRRHGHISVNTGVKLVDPGTGAAHDGRVTFSELLSGATVVSDVSLSASGSVTLPLTFTGLDLLGVIAPADPKLTLNFSASPITFTSDLTGFPDLQQTADFFT